MKNAVVKQTDAKTAVLTTATQEGGKEYTVSVNGETIGKFAGVAAVIPTTIKLDSTSAQSKVGNEVTLKADIGVKAAGVPVTFNVDAPVGSLNKDQIVEVYTNAEGIATYSYTQYSAGQDLVAVYPTGAPTVRDIAKVYWGVNDILTVTAADNKTNALTNGEKKSYKVVYNDAVTGKPVANKTLLVTFQENVNVPYNTISKATVTDLRTGHTVTPYQTAQGVVVLPITTDINGEASFTVTGTNTKATPIVFADDFVTDTNNDGILDRGNTQLDAFELKAVASTLTFVGAQETHGIEITAAGGEEAASGITNGRVYKVAVKDKDGKAYAGGVVNVALNENYDDSRTTATNAKIKGDTEDLVGSITAGEFTDKITLKLNSKGEGEFIVYGSHGDSATPIVWIDQNNSVNTQSGKLESGEPFKLGTVSYFQHARIVGADLDAKKELLAYEQAKFELSLTNQSGKEITSFYNAIATYEIVNTGANDVRVSVPAGYNFKDEANNVVTSKVIEVGGKLTISGPVTATSHIIVETVNGKESSVAVSANVKTTTWANADNRETNRYFAPETVNTSFSASNLPASFSGNVTAISGDVVTLVNGAKTYNINFAKANSKFFYKGSTVESTYEFFKQQLTVGDVVNFTKGVDGAKNSFDLVTDTTPGTPGTPGAASISSAVLSDEVADASNAVDTLTLTFTEAVDYTTVSQGDFTFTGGTATLVAPTSNTNKLVFNITGGTITKANFSAADVITFVGGTSNALGTAVDVTTATIASKVFTTKVNTAATGGTNATATATIDGENLAFTVLATDKASNYNNLKFKFEQGTDLEPVVTAAGNVITIKLGTTGTNNTLAKIQAGIDALTDTATVDYEKIKVSGATWNAAEVTGVTIATPEVTLAGGVDGSNAVKGQYKFTLYSNLTVGDQVVVNGNTYVAGTDFVVGSAATVTAGNLVAAIKAADTRFASTSTSSSATITLDDDAANGATAPTFSIN